MSAIGTHQSPTLRQDLTGGLVSAAVAIPLAMGYGMFAFGALGDRYFASGALAGLYAAVVAGIVSVLLGDRSTMIYAPRIITTFFLGALLYNLVEANGGDLQNGSLAPIIFAFSRSFSSAAHSRRSLACCASVHCCGSRRIRSWRDCRTRRPRCSS